MAEARMPHQSLDGQCTLYYVAALENSLFRAWEDR
jgi:hypothetical protein